MLPPHPRLWYGASGHSGLPAAASGPLEAWAHRMDARSVKASVGLWDLGTGKLLEDGKIRPISVKVGERVLFGKYAGQAVKVNGEEVLVLREDDIIGVIEA